MQTEAEVPAGPAPPLIPSRRRWGDYAGWVWLAAVAGFLAFFLPLSAHDQPRHAYDDFVLYLGPARTPEQWPAGKPEP